MLRSILCAFALLTTPVMAFEIETMTDAERDIFRAEIRDYLIENPEVLMEAIAVLEERRAAQAEMAEQEMLVELENDIFNDDHSLVAGNPEGDITVVEFFDYRCGFCKRAFPEVKELIETDGNIRYVMKEFPILGEESELASRYAIAVKLVEGDDAYAVLRDSLMEWTGPITEGTLARVANDALINHEAVLAQIDSDEVSEIITANRQLAAHLQIQGTPSFVMGTRFIRGYADLEQMRAIIAEERANQG